MLERISILAEGLYCDRRMSAARIDPRISWTVSHMQRHFAEPTGVGELAARINLSPSRFRALFTAQTGVSPAQFLRRLRLRRARLLLEHSFLSVKEVMAAVGYSDPSHFARDFRRAHGTSPTGCRSISSADPLTVRRIGPPSARDPGRACA
jgi:transcriptional regulator GlxA family with amidase domain